MKYISIALGITLSFGLAAAVHSTGATTTPSPRPDAIDYSTHPYCQDLTDYSECAGLQIWFYATGGNERFFTYVYPQRFGVVIDWYRILKATSRDDRFYKWGLINDPECCKPGADGCPIKSLDETYGFDYCPGDDALLGKVGKPGYRDPACDFQDAALDQNDLHGPKDQRQSPCDLRFGTSTGAMGIRKFPNPKFNKQKWLELNKKRQDQWAGAWEGYTKRMKPVLDETQPEVSHIMDGALEPPFLIGISCGSCHIAFDPLNPPQDPRHPKLENISGTVGNQYARFSQILGSGMDKKALEYQVFGHARPGVVDTSAIPTDQINNPGTMNAIINFGQRPRFPHEVMKWRKIKKEECRADSKEPCWCEPGKDGKCWKRSFAKDKDGQNKPDLVNQILKGGEDSIGINEAVQRVYFNIGSCSEESWVNHLTDMRQLDPEQRGFGQTPFEIGQARRDCPQFRAIEDRLDEIVKFLLAGGPSDLYKARGLHSNRELIDQLEKKEYWKGAVDKGKEIFAKQCAKCHSSEDEPFTGRNFREVTVVKDGKEKEIRKDWLGNDKLTLVTEVGTNQARALHSNHMDGHIWAEYGSETLRAKSADDPDIKELATGGRGYYRNISLLSVWAHAPFMHNNAIGPELYGGAEDEHYHSPYVDAENQPLKNPPSPWRFDPSVEGRYKLFKASMDELLNPSKRLHKVTNFNREVVARLIPKLKEGNSPQIFNKTIVFPAGIPSPLIGNFRHKEYVADLIAWKKDSAQLKRSLIARHGPKKGEKVFDALEKRAHDFLDLDHPEIKVEESILLEAYSNSPELRENEGHPFGEDLSDQDKKALTAFLATL